MRLTKGYYAVEERENYLLVNDLRFGQNNGWVSAEGNFIFSYFIKPDEKGKAEIIRQENSFENAGESMRLLWERIKGI